MNLGDEFFNFSLKWEYLQLIFVKISMEYLELYCMN